MITVTTALRRDAARLYRLIGYAVALLGMALLAERFGPLLAAIVSDRLPADASRQAGVAFALTVPSAIYLAGLWSVRPALAAIRDGALFAAAISSSLTRVGAVLVLGAALDVAIKPSILALLGSGPGYVIALDFASFALGGIGIALIFLARLIDRAAAVKAELDGIF